MLVKDVWIPPILSLNTIFGFESSPICLALVELDELIVIIWNNYRVDRINILITSRNVLYIYIYIEYIE